MLGKTTASVYYNLGIWVVISSEGTGTDVLLTGSPEVYTDYWTQSGVSSFSPRSGHSRIFSGTAARTLEAVPLAVKFKPVSSGGTVIYTTFHNEAQESDLTPDAKKILQDFIFTL